jgi:hypothetical protein
LFTQSVSPLLEFEAHCVSGVVTVNPFSASADFAAVVIAEQSAVLPQVLISIAPAKAAASTAACLCRF